MFPHNPADITLWEVPNDGHCRDFESVILNKLSSPSRPVCPVTEFGCVTDANAASGEWTGRMRYIQSVARNLGPSFDSEQG